MSTSGAAPPDKRDFDKGKSSLDANSFIGNKNNLKEKKCDQTLTVEEAIPLTGVGAFHYALLVVCGMCGASAAHEIVSPSYILTSSAPCDLNMDTNAKSLLSAMAFIGMISGTHIWGILCDRLGRIVVLRFSLLADAAVSILASLLPSAPLFIAARFVNGLLIAAPPSCSLAYLSEFHGEKSRARALVLFGFFPGGAIIVIAGMAYLMLPLEMDIPLPWVVFRSWRLFVMLNGVPSLLTGLALFWFPESPRFLVSKGRPDLALTVLQRVHAVNSMCVRRKEEFPVAAILGPAAPPSSHHDTERSGIGAVLLSLWEQTVYLFKPPFLRVTFVICVINFALLCICNGLLVWIPDIFNRMSLFTELHPDRAVSACEAVRAPGANLIEIGATNGTMASGICKPAVLHDAMFVSTAIIGMANLAVCLSGVMLVNILGKRLLLGVSLLLSGVFGYLINVTSSTLILMAVACGHIALSNMCVSVVISVFVENVPTKVRGTAVSLAMMAGRFGSMSGSYITGRLLDTHCEEWFWSVSSLAIVCALLSFFLPKRGTYAK